MEAAKPGQTKDMVVRLHSLRDLKTFTERFRQRMLGMNPNFFEDGMPIRLHVQLVPSEEERDALKADPNLILKAARASDVVKSLVILESDKAQDLSVDDMCALHDIDKENIDRFAIIAKKEELENAAIETSYKTIVIESLLEDITPSTCDVALNLLAHAISAEDKPIMPGVLYDRHENKKFWYIIKSLPDADTASFHKERDYYYRLIQQAVDF